MTYVHTGKYTLHLTLLTLINILPAVTPQPRTNRTFKINPAVSSPSVYEHPEGNAGERMLSAAPAYQGLARELWVTLAVSSSLESLFLTHFVSDTIQSCGPKYHLYIKVYFVLISLPDCYSKQPP